MFKKVKVAAMTLALIYGVSSTANAGIPTIDPSAIASELANHLETIKQWEEQFNAMKKQYDAISGINSWQDFINSEFFWDFFPKEAQDILNGNASTDEIMDKINKSIATDSDFENFKKKELNRLANQTESAKKNYEASMKRGKEIEEFMQGASRNEDLKSSMDFSNAISGKIAMLLNELSRMQAEAQVYEADDKETRKVEDERAKKAMDMSNGIKVYPIGSAFQ